MKELPRIIVNDEEEIKTNEKPTIEFEIKRLDNKRMQEFLSAIRSKFIIPLERKVNIEFYLPEDDEYTSSDFYMPDPELNIERIENGSVYYTKTTIKFIGY